MANGGKAGKGKAASAAKVAAVRANERLGGKPRDPAKQKLGGPCSKCGKTDSITWYSGPKCHACYAAERKEKKRTAELAEQKGKQTIEQVFAAAATKKQNQE
jgi:hypothetical protein